METTNTAQVSEPKVHTFTDEELASYIANIQKEKYESGKIAGVEMQVKQLKKEYGIDEDGIKDFKTFAEKLLQVKTSTLQTELESTKQSLNGETQKLVTDYESKFKALQDTLTTREKELMTIAEQKENELKKYKVETTLIPALDLAYEVPQAIATQGDEAVNNFLQVEKQKTLLLFKSLHQIDFDATGQIIVKDSNGDVIKDRLQNPEKLQNVVKEFTKKYHIATKSDTNGTKYTGTKAGAINYARMSLEQFNEAITSQGVSKSSNEYIKLYADWKKSQNV